jgi:Suppressor of fused protein (SUFU)
MEWILSSLLLAVPRAMTIRVACDRCGKGYKVRDEFAGRKVKCKICQAVLDVPLPAETSSPIIRHQERSRQFEFAIGDEQNIERISQHIQAHIGEVESVFHEIVSDLVHLDVHFVPPTAENPCHTLVTSGMSDREMTVPEGCEKFRRAELFLSLPEDWPLDTNPNPREEGYWPIRWLKTLARFPHEYETWLGYGHSVPNGDPPAPVADDTKFCGFILGLPQRAPQEFTQLDVDEESTIWFWALYPLYREEINFKLKHGSDALFERLENAGVTEMVDIDRPNVCRKRFGLF